MTPATQPQPPQSALSSLISSHTQTPPSPQLALALTVLHNLQYQHSWTALSLHAITTSGKLISIPTASSLPEDGSSSSSNNTIDTYLIYGLPPKHSYIHPSLQNLLVRRRIDESRLAVQPEWVLPVGTAGSGGAGGGVLRTPSPWTLKRLSFVFDALAPREVVTLHSDQRQQQQRQQEQQHDGREGAEDESEIGVEWRDPKRVVMGMLAANGKGGDSTIVYYIMHEGEVKPRQNG